MGDAIRGDENPVYLDIFQKLLAWQRDGLVCFPNSLPLLSETIQNVAEKKESILARAQVMEDLCGTASLPYPTLIVASEIAEVAALEGLGKRIRPSVELNFERDWYPDISDNLVDYRDTIFRHIDKSFPVYPLEPRSQLFR